jgi:hypothetical protein
MKKPLSRSPKVNMSQCSCMGIDRPLMDDALLILLFVTMLPLKHTIDLVVLSPLKYCQTPLLILNPCCQSYQSSLAACTVGT